MRPQDLGGVPLDAKRIRAPLRQNTFKNPVTLRPNNNEKVLKSEYDWIKERLTDYNLGWANGYSVRMARFSRRPDLHANEIHIF